MAPQRPLCLPPPGSFPPFGESASGTAWTESPALGAVPQMTLTLAEAHSDLLLTTDAAAQPGEEESLTREDVCPALALPAAQDGRKYLDLESGDLNLGK